MTFTLIHTGRPNFAGERGEPQVHEIEYRDVEAIVAFFKEPWHPYSGPYDRWVEGELQTEYFTWDFMQGSSVQHAVRGADTESHEALVEACRLLNLPLPTEES